MDRQTEFLQKKAALIAACKRVSEAVLHSTCPYKAAISSQFREVADVLSSNESLEVCTSAANSIRGMYHKEGFYEYAPDGFPEWEADTNLIFDYSTIYIESKYADVRDA